jgi:membrane protein
VELTERIQKGRFSLKIEPKVSDRLRSIPVIIIVALQNFLDARATEAAAGIAYYTLFSLFPLLLIIAVLGSTVLEIQQVQEQVLTFVKDIIPPAYQLVDENINRIFDSRLSVGIIAVAGLVWASTSVFIILARNIDRAWQEAEPRNFLKWRLVGLAMAGSLLGGLLVLWLVSTTVFGLLTRLDMPLWDSTSFFGTISWKVLNELVPCLLMFVMAFVLYTWAPNTKVKWSEAAWGALFTASGWEISKISFDWYLASGLARHQLIYGSLGSVVALMLWVYLSALIILFGAHLGAAIGRYCQAEQGKIP